MPSDSPLAARVTAIVHDDAARAAFSETLTAIGCIADVAIGDPRLIGRRLAYRAPDLWLIETDLAESSQVAALEEFIGSIAGGVPVMVAATTASLSGVRALVRFGIADVLAVPLVPAELAVAIATAIGPRKAASGPRHVVSFLKGGGGAGATTLATQVACTMGHAAGDGRSSVCLIDFDIQFGSVALHLDLLQNAGLLDVLLAAERLDGSMLRGAMARHGSGIDVLPAPAEMHPLEVVTPELSLRLIEIARHQYKTVFLDLPQAWTIWTRSLLSASTAIVLVLLPTVPSARHARRQLDTLAEEGLNNIPITVIANRVEGGLFGGGIPLKELERALGRPVDQVFADYGQVVTEAVNVGRHLGDARGGRQAARQLRLIAARIAGTKG